MNRLSTRALILAGLAVSLLLAGIASFYASANPDGLEYVAAEKGFDGTAKEHASAGSPLSDYGVQGIDDSRLSGGLAGVIGVLLVAAIAFALMYAVRRRGRAVSEVDPSVADPTAATASDPAVGAGRDPR